jgi:O-antigen/teichoic acid export membrane protein
MLMGLVISLRWISGLYRGAITGFERLVWLSGLNISAATARFVLVIPLFIYVGASPTFFFTYQLLVAVLELLALVLKTYKLLPASGAVAKAVPWEWGALSGVLKFSLSIAFTSSAWVLVTQTDKLILSKFLPLSQYAYFSLAVMVASGVSVISGPISGALMPRLTRLSAEANENALLQLYRNATQLVAIIAIPAACVLALFSHEVLWAWTGNAAIAASAAPVLALYSIGNGILALEAFPYYLQYAKGDLKLHLVGNAIFVVLLIPAVVWATSHYGAVGAGYAWVSANALYFLLWVPRVHARFAPGLHLRWLTADVAGIAGCACVAALAARQLIVWPQGRAGIAFVLATVSFFVLLAGAIGAPLVRGRVHRWLSQPTQLRGRHEHVE